MKAEEHKTSPGGFRDRFLGWLLEPTTPIQVTLAAALGFWMFEAALHAEVFDHRAFATTLFTLDGHELWMRSVVTTMLLALGVAWRFANIERQRRLQSMERYQERLRELTAELAYGDADERQALARRLHDDVGQNLAAARLFLGSVDSESVSDDAALKSVSRIIDRATTEVREVAEELSPRSLEEFGLAEAIASLARRLMRRSGVSIELDLESSCGSLSADSMRLAFLVAAKVIETAAGERSTNSISVRCGDSAGSVEITMSWPGTTTEDFYSEAERLECIGGTLELTSDPIGTTVRIRVPSAA